jgi:hypothetical protein
MGPRLFMFIRHDYDQALSFLLEAEERWPELKEHNWFNADLIKTYGALKRHEDVVRVFEEQVVRRPNSEFGLLECEVVCSYGELGQGKHLERVMGEVLRADANTVLAREIEQCMSLDDKENTVNETGVGRTE